MLVLCLLAASGSLARGEARSRRETSGCGAERATLSCSWSGARRSRELSRRFPSPGAPADFLRLAGDRRCAARRSHATANKRSDERTVSYVSCHTHVMRIDCVRRLRSFPSAFSRSQEHHFALHHALDAVIVSFSSFSLPHQVLTICAHIFHFSGRSARARLMRIITLKTAANLNSLNQRQRRFSEPHSPDARAAISVCVCLARQVAGSAL